MTAWYMMFRFKVCQRVYSNIVKTFLRVQKGVVGHLPYDTLALVKL